MDNYPPRWLGEQAGFDEANIDPKLLENFGGWSTSEESKTSNEVGTEEQAGQDCDHTVNAPMTYATPTGPAQAPPSSATPTAQDEGPWLPAQTSRRKYPIRQSRPLQHMLPTPDASSGSHQHVQNASAYQHVEGTWQSTNPFGLLSAETSRMPQDQDLGAGNAFSQYGTLTPTSQPHQTQLFDNTPAYRSPLVGRGLPQHEYEQPMQGGSTPAANFHGWHQPNIPPSEDIASWTHGAYSVAANFCNVSPTPSHPKPDMQQNKRRGKRTASQRSGPSGAGSVPCTHSGCNKRFENKSDMDHHARNHNLKKRTKLCSICHKSFLFEKDVKRHMKVHQEARHIFCNYLNCPYRTKGFKRQDHLDRHVMNVHNKVKEEE